MSKPIIAITMGDAAGIGPELIVKVLSQDKIYDICCPFVIGDPGVMTDICAVVGSNLQFKAIKGLADAEFAPPIIEVLRPRGLRIDHIPRGKVDPAMGKAAALCLKQAYEMAMDGEIQGVVSAPLNKEAFHLAGYHYRDELEYLADLTKSPASFMLGVMGSIWTIMVTEHISFREIADLINKDTILGCIDEIHNVLQKVKTGKPRIAVAALNVHAGEGGLFGREEIDEIGPAIQSARERGLEVQGPVPADMVFVRALEGDFDGVVCMYHDQANIARKLQPKSEGATIFLGLPVVCGTTAHGTAFDKAGLGIADPGSLVAALQCTVRLSS